MKPVYLLSALLFFSLRAQAPVPVPLARGDAPGEPHHHLKIENAYVRAYYVEVPPHGETQLHQHDHDYIFVILGASDVTNAVFGKPEVHLQLKDGEIRFTRGGFAHVARNNSDAPFRNVTIEFLRPQSEVHNRCIRVVDGTLDTCSSRPNNPASLLRAFCTEEVNVLSGLLKRRGAILLDNTKEKDALVVALSRLTVLSDAPLFNPPTIYLKSGDVAWIPATNARTLFKNERRDDARFLLILFRSASATDFPECGAVSPH